MLVCRNGRGDSLTLEGRLVGDRCVRVTSPARTCVSISASAASATTGSISTPRFIGPGCMTFCPGRRRSGVTPQRAAYSRSDGT